MFCSSCGQKLPSNVSFCTNCGAKLAVEQNNINYNSNMNAENVQGTLQTPKKSKKGIIIASISVFLVVVLIAVGLKFFVFDDDKVSQPSNKTGASLASGNNSNSAGANNTNNTTSQSNKTNRSSSNNTNTKITDLSDYYGTTWRYSYDTFEDMPLAPEDTYIFLFINNSDNTDYDGELIMEYYYWEGDGKPDFNYIGDEMDEWELVDDQKFYFVEDNTNSKLCEKGEELEAAPELVRTEDGSIGFIDKESGEGMFFSELN